MIQHDMIQYDKSMLYYFNTSAFHVYYAVTKVFGFSSGINICYFLFIFHGTELSNFETRLLEKVSNTLCSSVLTGV